MNFDQKYPQAQDNQRPEPWLMKTSRYFYCHWCYVLDRKTTRTGWRHMGAGLGVPCCSEECLARGLAEDPPEGLDPDFRTPEPPGPDVHAAFEALKPPEDHFRFVTLPIYEPSGFRHELCGNTVIEIGPFNYIIDDLTSPLPPPTAQELDIAAALQRAFEPQSQ